MSRYSAPTIDHPIRNLRRGLLSRRSRFADCSVSLIMYDVPALSRFGSRPNGTQAPHPSHRCFEAAAIVRAAARPKVLMGSRLQPVPFPLTIGALNGLLSEERFEDDGVLSAFAETREKNPWIDRCISNWQSLAHLYTQGAGPVIPVDFAGSPKVRQCRQ